MSKQGQVVNLPFARNKRSEFGNQVSHLEHAILRLKASLADAEFAEKRQSFPQTTDAIRSIIRARRLRESVLGTDLFFDPAWDMLLEAYAAYLAADKISVSGLCFSSAVPHTTALRWSKKLELDGWLVREVDRRDARRHWVSLSDRGIAGLTDYFSKLSSREVIL